MTATTPDTTAQPEPTPVAEPAQDQTDWKAKFDEVQAQARKHEDRAKANAAAAKELETLKQSTMSEIEKAVATAKVEARSEMAREVGGQLVHAEIRAAAAGRGVDIDALLEGIDPVRFLGDDLQPDRKMIAAWVDRVAPVSVRPGFPDLGQGARGGGQDMALNGDPLLRDIKTKLGMS